MKMDRELNYAPCTPEEVWALLRENLKFQNEVSRQIQELKQTMGGWSNNHGFFAEEYFTNSFKKGQRNFFGENFDRLIEHAKGTPKEREFTDEYDILLINGKSVGIVEIKFKAHENDVPKVLRKAETFKVNFPEYKNHHVYLGLASMVFYPELEQKGIDHGIAVIKQIGKTVVINDENLKVY